MHKNFGLAHFGFQHLIATNVSVWVRTLAQEILDEYIYVQNYLDYYQNQTRTDDDGAAVSVETDDTSDYDWGILSDPGM